MKKYILLPLAAAVMLAGCTTKEQDQQIRTFWMKQYMNVMVKLMSKKMDSLPQAARQKLAAPQVRAGGQNVHQPQRTQPAPQPQIMEVTLDTDALPGRAPHADRVRMKRALEAVQISNQNILSDIAVTFGDNVKTQALVLTAGTKRCAPCSRWWRRLRANMPPPMQIRGLQPGRPGANRPALR